MNKIEVNLRSLFPEAKICVKQGLQMLYEKDVHVFDFQFMAENELIVSYAQKDPDFKTQLEVWQYLCIPGNQVEKLTLLPNTNVWKMCEGRLGRFGDRAKDWRFDPHTSFHQSTTFVKSERQCTS